MPHILLERLQVHPLNRVLPKNTFTQVTEAERRPYLERLGDKYKGAGKYRIREDDDAGKQLGRDGVRGNE